MKNMGLLKPAVLAVVLLCGVAGIVAIKRHASRQATPRVVVFSPAEPVPTANESAPTRVPSEPPVATASAAPASAAQPVPPKTRAQPKNATAAANPGANPGKEPLKDPLARAALAFVGMDAEAEVYWYAAINDPGLSGHERQDLIEDLNEEGLSDPKRPTADDLPLIVNRLLLIEAVASDAMDGVNADAFQEAYKDLVNLANVAMGGGEPVR